MNIIDILSKSGLAGSQLISLLRRVVSLAPELSTEIEIWIEQLTKATAPEHLIELSQVVLKEIHDIAKGKIDPRSHPSDAA